MKKEPKKSVARIPEGEEPRAQVTEALLRGLLFLLSLTCAGSHPHDGIKTDDLLNVSPEVVEETLLVSLSLGAAETQSFRRKRYTVHTARINSTS